MTQAVLNVRAITAETSALARIAQCPSCASRDVADGPEEFDPGAFTAPLVCRCCTHHWSVRC